MKHLPSILIIASIPIILGLVFWLSKNNAELPANQATSLLYIAPSDHIKGSGDSKIELTEYSDFQCPACGAYYPYVKQIVDKFSDQIKFAYRHFPLSQHINANLAARTAEAAGKQGKFWEMHDLLFENQNSWGSNNDAKNIFIGFASNLGLDVEKFKADLNSKEIQSKVAGDFKGGVSAGVNSTPTFFLNGKMLKPNTMNPKLLEESVNATIQNQ